MHYPLGTVKRHIVRADPAVADKLGQFGVATVHEAMGRLGLMHTVMRPIYAGARVSGTAVTVLLHPGDNWMMHVVAEQIQPGDIVMSYAGLCCNFLRCLLSCSQWVFIKKFGLCHAAIMS